MGPLENVPERVAKLLGWNGEGGIHGAMQELQNASPASLVNAQGLLLSKEVMESYNFKLHLLPHRTVLFKTNFLGAKKIYFHSIWTNY